MSEKISVAIASYNGEKYIKEQILSILTNLGPEDEVIVSDDGSVDDTEARVKEINDARIKFIKGPGRGIKKNFENAIINCTGDYIFLSDQDDIWEERKVSTVLSAFKERDASVVVHDCAVVDEKENVIFDSFYKFRNSGPGIFKNIWKNTYIGCCMAFKSELKDYILPIPEDIEMHDQWIGLIGEKRGKSVFIEDSLIRYRRHGENASEIDKHHSVKRMIKARINLIRDLKKFDAKNK